MEKPNPGSDRTHLVHRAEDPRGVRLRRGGFLLLPSSQPLQSELLHPAATNKRTNEERGRKALRNQISGDEE
jgi:hypothetical protein